MADGNISSDEVDRRLLDDAEGLSLRHVPGNDIIDVAHEDYQRDIAEDTLTEIQELKRNIAELKTEIQRKHNKLSSRSERHFYILLSFIVLMLAILVNYNDNASKDSDEVVSKVTCDVKLVALKILLHWYESTRINKTELIKGFNGSYNVAVSKDGWIAVSETRGGNVTVISPDNKRKSFGNFSDPRGIAITNDGHIVVSDDHTVSKWTLDGVYINGTYGKQQFQFNVPVGLAVHPITGQIYVADSDNHCIQVLNSDFSAFGKIVYHGSISFQKLDQPLHIAFDSNGILYVTDFTNHRIVKFFSNGTFIPTKFPYIYQPIGIAIDSLDLIYVTSLNEKCVTVFDTNGNYLHKLCNTNFDGLRGITIDKSDNVYMSIANGVAKF